MLQRLRPTWLRLTVLVVAAAAMVSIASVRGRAASHAVAVSPTDPTWAQWPMPDSPTLYCSGGAKQLDCSTIAGTAIDGQDGTVVVNRPIYDTSITGTVKDSVTDLLWQRTVDGTPRKWADASTYCAGLNVGGLTGWRLPTAIELLSIVDLGRYDPAIDTESFNMPAVTSFWSSSAYARVQGWAWYLEFKSGTLADNGPDASYSVRCVH